MNSFDWLSDISQPGLKKYDVVEVKFKGGRKEYYRNVHQLDLTTGDYVVIDMQPGYHIGAVSMQGELVRLQVKKRGVKINDDTKVISRIATAKEMDRHEQAVLRDLPALYRSREIARELKLNMKLSDV